jgi:hypothetical protein
MSGDMAMFSQQLRWLVDEYYHQHISMSEYRAQRKNLFDNIEELTKRTNSGHDVMADLSDAATPVSGAKQDR